MKKREWKIDLAKVPTKNPKKKRRKTFKQFPPPFKPTQKVLDKLIKKYAVHANPDPPDCEYCGARYRDMKTGLDFQAVKDMLWVEDPDPDRWRHKGRHSVLGLWYEIKRQMWTDHLHLCGKPKEQAEWLEDFEDSDFAY